MTSSDNKKYTFWFINDYAGSIYHGMEYRNYNLARELVQKGHKVYIITASYSHLFRTLPKVDGGYTHEMIDGIEYIWVKVPTYKNSTDKKRIFKWFFFVWKLYFLPIKKLKQPDYVIASPMAPFLIMPSIKFARKYNAKLIYDVKDIWPLTLCELGGYSDRHPFIRLMQWFSDYAYKNADLTTTSLSNAYSYMKTRGLAENKFKFIPNGISVKDMEQSQPLTQAIIDQIPKKKFIVGYAGGMGIAKSLDTFIKAADFIRDYNDICLVLVGEGKYENQLKCLKNDMNLKNVIFINSIPKAQVQSILITFDVCFLATKKKDLYKFGVSQNKLYDYLYAAKPILYGVNDEKSVVERASCGVTVDSSDPKDIARGIIVLYNTPIEKRVQMGLRGKQLVLDQYTYEKSAEAFIEALEKL